MTILKNNKFIKIYKENLSIKTRKEIERFFLSFAAAWFFKTLLNEFPFFIQLFYLGHFDTLLQNIIINETRFILNGIGYSVYTEGIFLQIEDTPGVRFEFGCLAVRHLTLFAVFILFYYGKWYHKVWYIICGVFVITGVNAIRASLLCIFQVHKPESFATMHDIVFPPFMYLLIFILWIIWVLLWGNVNFER